jgi:uncharacterized protein YecE (DUF72 family)
MTGDVRIGTSGYSFADWVGTVYPPGTKPGGFLSHYAKLFNSVEINATYYRTPSPQTFARMVEKTPEDFTFVVKVPRAMTHDLVAFDREVEPFHQAIEPLVRARRLGGLLAQFPYAFVPSEASRRHLAKLARSFGSENPVHVEFRHDAWANEATFDLLRTLGLGFVNVDLPELPHLPRPSEIATNRTGYVRLHGRNETTWWNHDKALASTLSKAKAKTKAEANASAGGRYDYLYSKSELEPWAARIERLAAETDVTYVFANNCHLGQSVVNALQLGQRLGHSPAEDTTSLFTRSLDETIRDMQQAIASRKEREEKPRVAS